MVRWMSVRSMSLLVLLGLAGFPGSAGAGEAYYLLMFGSQRIPNNPNYSHTFATFVRATWQGDGFCPHDLALEAHTISWMPANLKIRTSALRPECGRNLGLHESVRFGLDTDQRVSLWGPYPIDPELYRRALQRKAELESGSVQYKANDVGYRSDHVSNCIHAVSTAVEGPKLRVAVPGWGESASFYVLLKMDRYLLSREPQPWVSAALGLDEYQIHHRDYRNPLSNAVFGPVFRLFGGERDLRPTYGRR